MTLREYRLKFELTLEEVANAVNLSVPFVSKHDLAQRMPSAAQIAEYERFTKGAVRFDDWINPGRLGGGDRSVPKGLAPDAAPAAAPEGAPA